MYRILVVEDDLDLCELLNLYLTKGKYEAIFVHTGKAALELLEKGEMVDLILLDIMLPDIDGTLVCREIRRNTFCPIIFMSAIDDNGFIIKALEFGGDDYVIKPINYEQLIARVEANIRRSKNYSRKEKHAESFAFGNFVLKFNERFLYRDGEPQFLSPTQLNLLLYLVENKDQLLTYEQIFRDVWHQEHIGDVRSLAVHISNLRNVLEPYDCIVSVRGEGYRFDTSKL